MKNIQEIWEDATRNFDTYRDPLVILKDVTAFYIDLLNGDDYHAYILYLFLTFHLQKNLPDIPKTKYRNPERRFNTIPEVIEYGIQTGVFEGPDAHEMVRAYFACLEGLAYNRISLGRAKFKNVHPEVLYNFFIKKAH